MIEDIFKRVLTAKIYDVAGETQLTYASNLSLKTGNTVFLKREDLQVTNSFKVRGACNKIHNGNFDENDVLVTASAGNHAQGVALSSRKKGLRSIIIMPKNTPSIKIDSVRKLSGEVVLYGNNFTEAEEYARELSNNHGYRFIPPFDDLDVIAGQGTVAKEILQQAKPNPDAIFVPVGGGGLIAGVAAYVKHLSPSIRIIGVECDQAACLKQSLSLKSRIFLDKIGTFAEGVSVSRIGEIPFAIASDFVDDVVDVTPDEICSSVKYIYDDTRSLVENSGAVSVAGMIKYCRENNLNGKRFVCICSGGNANFDGLGYIAERSLIGEGKELLLAVVVPETIGYLKELCRVIDDRPIMEFKYKKNEGSNACIFLGVKVDPSSNDKDILFHGLNNISYKCMDLTNNEVAKLHLKHMLGYGGLSCLNEDVYRVDFPERIGALREFLCFLPNHIDITTFHYRNYGAAHSSVLIGVPKGQNLGYFLDNIGYQYCLESGNEALKVFKHLDLSCDTGVLVTT